MFRTDDSFWLKMKSYWMNEISTDICGDVLFGTGLLNMSLLWVFFFFVSWLPDQSDFHSQIKAWNPFYWQLFSDFHQIQLYLNNPNHWSKMVCLIGSFYVFQIVSVHRQFILCMLVPPHEFLSILCLSKHISLICINLFHLLEIKLNSAD